MLELRVFERRLRSLAVLLLFTGLFPIAGCKDSHVPDIRVAKEAAPPVMHHPTSNVAPPPSGSDEAPLAVFAEQQSVPVGKRVTCPVCGDEFVVAAQSPVRVHKGKKLVFCCDRCLPHFAKNPDIFLEEK